MDWDKVIEKVADVARRAFTLAFSLVLIIVAVAGTYIIGLAVWWVVRFAQAALGR